MLAVVFLGGVAYATMPWMKAFRDTYKPKAGTELARAGCAMCHVKKNGEGLNPYGKALARKPVNAASLKAIEKLDSDKDGVTNIAEIKAGTNPGDPKSKPAKK